MIACVADTHAILWYAFEPDKLSPRADSFLNAIVAQGNQIGVSAITFVELVYLTERSRIAVETLSRLATLFVSNPHSLSVIPLLLENARMVGKIDWHAVPDMPDRIIATMAVMYRVPLVSRDRKIIAAGLNTIW
jgi:PIN domain nuclease of toxin-antitoxin system